MANRRVVVLVVALENTLMHAVRYLIAMPILGFTTFMISIGLCMPNACINSVYNSLKHLHRRLLDHSRSPNFQKRNVVGYESIILRLYFR